MGNMDLSLWQGVQILNYVLRIGMKVFGNYKGLQVVLVEQTVHVLMENRIMYILFLITMEYQELQRSVLILVQHNVLKSKIRLCNKLIKVHYGWIMDVQMFC